MIAWMLQLLTIGINLTFFTDTVDWWAVPFLFITDSNEIRRSIADWWNLRFAFSYLKLTKVLVLDAMVYVLFRHFILVWNEFFSVIMSAVMGMNVIISMCLLVTVSVELPSRSFGIDWTQYLIFLQSSWALNSQLSGRRTLRIIL